MWGQGGGEVYEASWVSVWEARCGGVTVGDEDKESNGGQGAAIIAEPI